MKKSLFAFFASLSLALAGASAFSKAGSFSVKAESESAPRFENEVEADRNELAFTLTSSSLTPCSQSFTLSMQSVKIEAYNNSTRYNNVFVRIDDSNYTDFQTAKKNAEDAKEAAENEGKVVGVDVDQSFDSATVVTSAMKGLASSVQWALDKVYAEKFADIAGKLTSLGAKDDSVGLPTATWSLTKFTVDDYNKLFQDIVDGKVSVDSTVVKAGDIADVQFSNLTVNYQ